MKKYILKTILLLLISITLGCNRNNKNGDAQFYTYSPQSQINDSWIDNKQDALNSNLLFDDTELNKRNLDSLYKTKAQYFFTVGSGAIYTNPEKCSAKITNNTILIYYKQMVYTEPVGWLDYTYLCLEIDKIKYPNYKEMKIIFMPE